MAFVRFQDLAVYRLSEDLSDIIWEMVLKWKPLARDTVGKQIIKSADSIGANIAEGCGRHAINDNRRFIRIARGSLLETQHWLRRAFRRKLLTTQQVAIIQPLIEQLAPKLNAYLRSLNKSAKPNTKH
jgi:four helix bundle protein